MTDITDEQREAWAALTDYYPSAAEKVAPLLPSSLTTPQPAPLPTEPGTTIYGGGGQQPRTMFRVAPRIPVGGLHWIDEHGMWHNDTEARGVLGDWGETPPRVQREPITREQAIAAYEAATYETAYHPGIDAILALVNGADRD